MNERDVAMQSYMRFDEANPLPDLSDILLSNDNFCSLDVSKKEGQYGDLSAKGAVCQIVTCGDEAYTALLDNAVQSQHFDANTNNYLFSTQTLCSDREANNSPLTPSDSISDSVAEEEFLQQFNLSKCDRFSVVAKNNVTKKPVTRSIAKLKVARSCHKISTQSGFGKTRHSTLKTKIDQLKKGKALHLKSLAPIKTKPRDKLRTTNVEKQSTKEHSQQDKVASLDKEKKRERETVGGLCKVCKFSYTSSEQRKSHMLDPEHIVKAESFCGTNNSAIAEETRLLQCVKLPGKCPNCADYFSKRRDMVTHYRRKHSGLKPFKCGRCSTSFFRSCDFITHLRKHLGTGNFKCQHCSMAFRQKDKLTSHLISKHGKHDNRPRNYRCTECDETFITKTAVNYHINTHTGYRPLTCVVCGQSFRDTFALANHNRIHSGERPFKCEQCEFATSTKQQLERHKLKHTTIKQHKCVHCSYTTRNVTGLKRHLLQHSGLKPFKCPYCQYRCSNIENLRKHIKKTKKHIGLKIYPCPQCQFSSDEGSQLLSHVKQMHYMFSQEESAAKVAGILSSGDGSFDAQISEEADEVHPNSERLSEEDSKDKMLPRIDSPVPMADMSDLNAPSTIEMLMTDGDLFSGQAGVKGHMDSDEEPESMNALDSDFLNALIKIPNLQKVILPQAGDGNGPVTLVIGNGRVGEHQNNEENVEKSNEQSPQYVGAQPADSPAQAALAISIQSSNQDSEPSQCSGHQRYIISASGIRSYSN